MAHVLAKDLRESVLQAAFKGRLTDRVITDSVVNIKSSFTEEPPFDIPESWGWFNLRDLVWNRKQKTPDKLFSYIDIGSIDNINQKLNDSENLIEPNKAPSRARKVVEYGDIIYSTVRPYLHNMAIIDRKFSHEPIASTGFATMVCNNGVLNKYLFLYLKSPEFDKYANDTSNAKGVAYPAINDKKLYAAAIPLPPIEEQARIVARVDELMAKIDEYEKLENELVELKKNFPGDMKAAVLQATMQGKLTEQKSTELISKVKREAISDEYDTFDIPDNWQWNTIDSVMNVTTGLTFNKLDQRPAGSNTLRVLRGGNILDNFNYGLFENDVYVTYRDKHIPLLKDDVITPAVTSMEKMCKVGYIEKDLPNITAGGFVYILRAKDTEALNPRYMMYFFNSAFNRNNCNVNIHKSGQAFYNLKKSGMVTQPIPLPPIEEQRRIVEKLDKILPLCEELEKEIA